MEDLVYMLASVACFAVSLLYVAGCERLKIGGRRG